MADFSETTNEQLAAQAERGHLRALGTLLRNIIDTIQNLSNTELGFLDGVTAGEVTASKAVVVDANKKIDEITVADFKREVNSATTGANVSFSGITQINTTAAKAYTMDAPTAGAEAILACINPSTGDSTVQLASGTFDGTNDVATFGDTDDVLHVVGLTTALCQVVAKTTGVTLGTT